MKTLKQILGDLGGYTPKAQGEQEFVKKHVTATTADANGNSDDVFKATNVKVSDRAGERHGYTDEDDDIVSGDQPAPSAKPDQGEAEWAKVLKKYMAAGQSKVAEEAELSERHLTPAEISKRETIARAIAKANPGMDKSKKMAIATAQAKRVAEEVELDEAARQLVARVTSSPDSNGVVHQLTTHKLANGKHSHFLSNDKGVAKSSGSIFSGSVGNAEKHMSAVQKHIESGDTAAAVKYLNRHARGTWTAKTGQKLAEDVDQVTEAADTSKKTSKGKGVPASGVYDSIPLGITVANEEFDGETNTSLLEMFAALDQEEQGMFIEMLETDGALLKELAQEAK